MPSYEASLVLRSLTKLELAAILKRSALKIFDKNGILFSIENLGTRKLPFAISKHSTKHREGSYFIFKFDGPTQALNDLRDEYDRDVDIIRAGFARVDSSQQPEFECTLDEEMKPPAYRKDVQEMIEKGRNKEKYKQYDLKIDLPYNPWR